MSRFITWIRKTPPWAWALLIELFLFWPGIVAYHTLFSWNNRPYFLAFGALFLITFYFPVIMIILGAACYGLRLWRISDRLERLGLWMIHSRAA